MQNEIKTTGDLLNQDGTLTTSGWAKGLVLNYNKFDIKAPLMKIKEWDRYLVYNNRCAVILSIEDYFYMGFVTASIINFKTKTWNTNTVKKFFTNGKFHMSGLSNSGDTTFTNNRVGMNFSCSKGKRFLKCEFVNFNEGKSLYANLNLNEPTQDSMVSVTPFEENSKFFSYAQKINGMSAKGLVKYGGEEMRFDEETSFADLNWNRGAWPSEVNWCQATACCRISNRILSFNIGYGYGDGSVTENAIFYDGKIQKLSKVKIQKPKGDILKSWNIIDSDNRLKMRFDPCVSKRLQFSKFVISINKTQLFGNFSGVIVLDNDVVIKIKNVLGFIEIASNRW